MSPHSSGDGNFLIEGTSEGREFFSIIYQENHRFFLEFHNDCRLLGAQFVRSQSVLHIQAQESEERFRLKWDRIVRIFFVCVSQLNRTFILFCVHSPYSTLLGNSSDF